MAFHPYQTRVCIRPGSLYNVRDHQGLPDGSNVALNLPTVSLQRADSELNIHLQGEHSFHGPPGREHTRFATTWFELKEL